MDHIFFIMLNNFPSLRYREIEKIQIAYDKEKKKKYAGLSCHERKKEGTRKKRNKGRKKRKSVFADE